MLKAIKRKSSGKKKEDDQIIQSDAGPPKAKKSKSGKKAKKKTSGGKLKASKKKSSKSKFLKKMKSGSSDMDLLITDNPFVLKAILEKCEDENVGAAIASLMIGKPQIIRLINMVIKDEIADTLSEELILRGTGIRIKSLIAMVQLASKKFLPNILQPIISKIIKDKNKNVEINPSKIGPKETVEGNFEYLKTICDKILENITENIPELPETIVYICSSLYSEVKNKFSGCENFAVTSFISLRFIVPALTLPEKYGILKDCSIGLRKKLVLIGKLLQNCFNKADEEKESFMSIASDYIAEKGPMIDEIAEIVMNKVNQVIDSQDSQLEDNNNNNGADQKERKSKLKVKIPKNDTKLSLIYFEKYIEEDRENLLNHLRSIENLEESDMYACIKSSLTNEFKNLCYPQSIIESLNCQNIYDKAILYLEAEGSRKGSLDGEEDDLFAMFEETVDESFDNCILKAKSSTGVYKYIDFEKSQLTIPFIQQIVRAHYSDIGGVKYTKDGEYYNLNKATFNDFATSCTVKKNVGTFQVFILPTNNALGSYMEKL